MDFVIMIKFEFEILTSTSLETVEATEGGLAGKEMAAAVVTTG